MFDLVRMSTTKNRLGGLILVVVSHKIAATVDLLNPFSIPSDIFEVGEVTF